MNKAAIGRKERPVLAHPLVSLLLAAVFALVFYISNTPIGPSISSDNAMYLTMGTALAKGYAPYTQIFDHKGPLLFILQTIPQWIAGGYSTLAVWIQEVVFLFLTLRVLEGIARRTKSPALLAQLVYLALTALTANGGNLTEEYANLFTACGISLMLSCFGEEKRDDLFRPAVLLGALSMAAFMTRANNVLVLMAMALVLALGLVLTRRFAALGRCAAGMALGCAVVAVPILLWLGLRGALYEAFYASIIHNMMYAATGSASRVATLLKTPYGWTAMLMAALSCAGALALYKKKKDLLLPLSMIAGAAAAGAAAFISHKFYLHYLLLGAPLAAVGAGLLVGMMKKRGAASSAAMILCVLALGIEGMAAYAGRLEERGDWEGFCRDANALYDLVPESDRDSFMAYRVEPKWYVAAKALPCMRFYFLQEILGAADPAVMDEVAERFETDPPRWVVIFYNREFGPPYDPRVAEVFETRYDFVKSAGEYQLLRLNTVE